MGGGADCFTKQIFAKFIFAKSPLAKLPLTKSILSESPLAKLSQNDNAKTSHSLFANGLHKYQC